MAHVPVWHGRMSDDGRLGLLEVERDIRRAFFRTLAGEPVEVIVKKRRAQRSLDQNSYLHAVPFLIIADYTGDDMESVKYDLMGECWGWKTSTLTGQTVPVKPSTSSMSVEEADHFIEWLPPWALRKLGLIIPLPEKVDVS